MKFCSNCGQELSDLESICPHCGQQAAPQASVPETETAVPAEDTPVTEPETEAVQDAPATAAEAAEKNPEEIPEASTDVPEEESDAEDSGSGLDADSDDAPEPEVVPETAADEPKKRSSLPIILTAIIGLLVIIVVCLTITLTTLSSTGNMPGFVTKITNWAKNLGYDEDAVAVNITDQDGGTLADITNAELSYYYWGEFYYYVQSSGMPFDADTPLDEQSYSDSQSWQDYFVENACASLVQIESLKTRAEAEGFTMPEDYQAEYESTVSSMENYAVQTGFTKEDGTGDVLAYVQDSYGSAATVEAFQQYLYDSYYVTAYSDTIYEGLTFTDQEIEDYFDQNSEMFAAYGLEKSDTPNVNVRHILISPEQDEDDESGEISDEAWEKAKQEAEDLLKEWKSGEATEESFGALAEEHSTDGGSSANGGLYEDVYPGQMVTEFNDWCFDDKRAPGDTGIVKTSYGYHIMYFVSETDNYYWKDMAKNELHYARYQETLTGITEQYTATPTEKLQLPTPDAVEAIQQRANNAAASSNTGSAAETETESSAVTGAAG